MKHILTTAACLLSISFPAPSLCADTNLIAGHSPDQAMNLGETMYRTGILPSGEPMQAFVQGDIPVDGSMFSCESCHLRSGLGTTEGTIITLPTNGGKLFKPLHRGAEIDVRPSREQLSKPFQSPDIRPAYTIETLKDAIWTGTDPGGRALSGTMPRYLLDPGDMDILAFYLKNLSTDYSPGVDATTLYFATIVTDDIGEAERTAFLKTLQAHVTDHNAQGRHEVRRTKQGPFYKQDRYTAYRLFDLSVWELSGPPETWGEQLETYYDKKPVFAILSGLSHQDWQPIHDFTEKKKLPCILPLTDRPSIAEEGWYTLYFSKGPYQEGEATARYLRPGKGEQVPNVVQIVTGAPESLAAAGGFSDTWTRLGFSAPETVSLETKPVRPEEPWKALAGKYPGATFLIWLPGDGLDGISHVFDASNTPGKVILSGSLLQRNLEAIPESIRDMVLVTWPYRLPDDLKSRERLITNWLRTRNVPVENMKDQSDLYFLGWLLTGVTRMMGDDFYRDYLFDVIDMMNDETYAIANYPRLSFGPGQRFASKGCYMAKIGNGEKPALTALTPWVIH